MKNILKIILGFICYKIEFTRSNYQQIGWKKLPEGYERYRFVAKPKKFGVIEFQMEFAYEGFKPIDVRNCMENSINYYIKKLC